MKNGMRANRNHRIKAALLRISDRINQICHVAPTIGPPSHLSFQYGSGSYFEVGLHFFKLLLDHGGLTREARVLEVGCGVGRMAMPLTAYLTGQYDGFDIMPEGITHCDRHISRAFPNFRFQRADVFNSYYNPTGAIEPAEYRFPFADQTFDLVFSTSVFTHLPPAVLERYIAETARVLKPGGRCLHTCFVLNEETLKGVREHRDSYGIRHEMDGFMTSDPSHIEAAIAVSEETFLRYYESTGLAPTVYLGGWSGRAGAALSHQDVIVGVRS